MGGGGPDGRDIQVIGHGARPPRARICHTTGGWGDQCSAINFDTGVRNFGAGCQIVNIHDCEAQAVHRIAIRSVVISVSDLGDGCIKRKVMWVRLLNEIEGLHRRLRPGMDIFCL